MREIKYIVLHCTATARTATVTAIQNYWRNTLKWRNPGYHYLIEPNGKVHHLHPLELSANGAAGYNANSIHISYIGGIDSKGKAQDNRTAEQVLAQLELLIELKRVFPKAEILGHRDLPGVKKDCPSFNVKEWIKHVKL